MADQSQYTGLHYDPQLYCLGLLDLLVPELYQHQCPSQKTSVFPLQFLVSELTVVRSPAPLQNNYNSMRRDSIVALFPFPLGLRFIVVGVSPTSYSSLYDACFANLPLLLKVKESNSASISPSAIIIFYKISVHYHLNLVKQRPPLLRGFTTSK